MPRSNPSPTEKATPIPLRSTPVTKAPSNWAKPACADSCKHPHCRKSTRARAPQCSYRSTERSTPRPRGKRIPRNRRSRSRSRAAERSETVRKPKRRSSWTTTSVGPSIRSSSREPLRQPGSSSATKIRRHTAFTSTISAWKKPRPVPRRPNRSPSQSRWMSGLRRRVSGRFSPKAMTWRARSTSTGPGRPHPTANG